MTDIVGDIIDNTKEDIIEGASEISNKIVDDATEEAEKMLNKFMRNHPRLWKAIAILIVAAGFAITYFLT